MKKKLILYYQKLSLIQKLSIPLILSLFSGLFLTTIIVKQVSIINKNTMLLKDELIPALEKSTNNRALLKKISENLTFATLAEEVDMLSEISDNISVEKNLRDMFWNEGVSRLSVDSCLISFKSYFTSATNFALEMIENSDLDSNPEEMHRLLTQYNEVEERFLELNIEIENKISETTELIESTSKEVIYFTVIYIIIFFVVLLFISYLIYKDFNERINSLSSSLNRLGLKKIEFESDDTIAVLSKNIKRAVKDYSIIEAQREELFKINRNINDSIEYASLIQEAILPASEILERYTEDYFICWNPRDTVGGDIYFISELKSQNEIIIMVIDGVGHGVSGAFLTILVKAIETQVIAKINSGSLDASPAKILEYFNQSIKIMLKQDKGSKSNAGFDGGVLYYNKITKRCKYAGAKTPLYIVKNNELEVIKSDRKNVGFVRTKMDQTYTEYEIAIEADTKLYITTDGIIDQEGEDKTMYGKHKFEDLILANNNQKFKQQKKNLVKSFIAFKGSSTQSDDITIVGIQF